MAKPRKTRATGKNRNPRSRRMNDGAFTLPMVEYKNRTRSAVLSGKESPIVVSKDVTRKALKTTEVNGAGGKIGYMGNAKGVKKVAVIVETPQDSTKPKGKEGPSTFTGSQNM